MKWALVIWALSADNFTVYEKFQTVEECLEKRETVTKALQQANSKLRGLTRENNKQKKKVKRLQLLSPA